MATWRWSPRGGDNSPGNNVPCRPIMGLILCVQHVERTMMESSPDVPARRPEPIELTPDQLEWARRQFSEEEYVAGIRDIRENGGVPLESIIERLELPVGGAHE
jgi:hypothetical protein